MISLRARQIAPSPTLAITAKAKALKASGKDLVAFTAGEPDFDTPQFIKDAAFRAMREGFTKYTATAGIPELKRAIAAKFRADNGLEYAPEEILVGNGAKQCLFNLILTLVNPDEEVILPVPYWVSYEEMIKMAGGLAVPFPAEKLGDPDALDRVINWKTKLLILNSPSNPSGVMLSKEQLQNIANVCERRHVFIISDEIYEKLTYGKPHVSIASLGKAARELTFTVNGFSKAYAMTGWRVGYCAGDRKVIAAASSLQDHSTSNVNSIAQKAALEALTNASGTERAIDEMRREYEKRRDVMMKAVGKMRKVRAATPDGAFYVWADVSAYLGTRFKGSGEFAEALLEKAGVAVIPGVAFGDDTHIRLSYATGMEEIRRGMERLGDFIHSLHA